MTKQYVDNEELRLGFEEMLELDYPHIKASGVAIEDIASDTSRAKISFTFSRPTVAEIETAKKEREEWNKLLKELEGGSSEELPELATS